MTMNLQWHRTFAGYHLLFQACNIDAEQIKGDYKTALTWAIKGVLYIYVAVYHKGNLRFDTFLDYCYNI